MKTKTRAEESVRQGKKDLNNAEITQFEVEKAHKKKRKEKNNTNKMKEESLFRHADLSALNMT